MASGIEEILTTLYEMVQDAWSLPLGADKCVLERDKVLDLLDEISNQLPGELKQAKTIVESRNEVITNAKREAENILKQAEQRARQMISHEEVYLQAQKEADDLMKNAQAKIKELRQVTNDYVDDSMKRTEDAIAQALSEIRESRSKFRALVNRSRQSPRPSSRTCKRPIPISSQAEKRSKTRRRSPREKAAGASLCACGSLSPPSCRAERSKPGRVLPLQSLERPAFRECRWYHGL